MGFLYQHFKFVFLLVLGYLLRNTIVLYWAEQAKINSVVKLTETRDNTVYNVSVNDDGNDFECDD